MFGMDNFNHPHAAGTVILLAVKQYSDNEIV